LVFKEGEGFHYWFSKGESICKMRNLFTLSPVLTGKKGGCPTIALYFTFLENGLVIMSTKVDYDP
jgi:hypothetical protein